MLQYYTSQLPPERRTCISLMSTSFRHTWGILGFPLAQDLGVFIQLFEITIDCIGCNRLTISAGIRDKHPDRCLRRRLFANILSRFPSLNLDGMAAGDGHNSQLPRFCCPSWPFFEADLNEDIAWLFPPNELIGPVLKCLHLRYRARQPVKVVLLVPECPSAPWFFMLAKYQRAFRYVAGSDLFREQQPDGGWRKLPSVREPWLVVASPEVAASV